MHDSSIYYGRILRNLMRLLDGSGGDSLYEVLPRGVQIWLPKTGLGLYPDLMVVAGEPLLHEGHSDKVINPCLVVEILSEPTAIPSLITTSWAERGPRFAACRAIPYLQEYVFVHQQEARVEQFCRIQADEWVVNHQSGLNSVVELNVTGIRLPLMAVYNRVDFEGLV